MMIYTPETNIINFGILISDNPNLAWNRPGQNIEFHSASPCNLIEKDIKYHGYSNFTVTAVVGKTFSPAAGCCETARPPPSSRIFSP